MKSNYQLPITNYQFPRRRAFTLIETLVAIAIIAAVLPILLSGISIANRAALLAKQRTLATTLGEAKLNELVGTDLWQSGALSGDFGDDAPGFTWNAVVTPYNDTDLTTQDLQEIDLTVSWKSRSDTRQVVLSTLIYAPTTTSTTGGTSQ
ncbi:MAG TPA: type II secretion system protein [Phycisphaerae bacterium]|nr:type II secretion system protein [Phycisphaerae bacterium]